MKKANSNRVDENSMKTKYTTSINTIEDNSNNNEGFWDLVVFWGEVLCFVLVLVLLFMYSFNLISKPNSAINIVIMLIISSTLALRIKKIMKELLHREENKAMKQPNTDDGFNPNNEQ